MSDTSLIHLRILDVMWGEPSQEDGCGSSGLLGFLSVLAGRASTKAQGLRSFGGGGDCVDLVLGR